jgi:hypothetical protein
MNSHKCKRELSVDSTGLNQGNDGVDNRSLEIETNLLRAKVERNPTKHAVFGG